MNPLTGPTALNAHGAAREAKPAAAPNPETLRVAREFETIFLRSLLGSLEKTTQMGSGGPLKAGQSAYGSMVVGAMSDAMSAAGGIGLAEVIARAMSRPETSGKGGPIKP